MSIQLPETLEGCHELIKRLVEITDTLVVRIEKLEQENRELKERLNNNSSNWRHFTVRATSPHFYNI